MVPLRVVAFAAVFAFTIALLAGCTEPSASGAEALPSASPAPSTGSTTVDPRPVQVSASATTGVIRGIVVDESIRPIAGADITLDAAGKTVISNTQGEFGFDGLEPGVYFLGASHARYVPVQFSATVAAGVDKPEPVKVALQLNATRVPSIEAVKLNVYVSSNYCVTSAYCSYVVSGNLSMVGLGSDSIYYRWESAAEAVQVEAVWDPTTPLGERAQLECYLFGKNADGDTIAVRPVVTGGSPLALRLPGLVEEDDGTGPADSVSCAFTAAPDTGTASAMVNQQLEVFIHVFHNFAPREGWVFSRDGEHPVPP